MLIQKKSPKTLYGMTCSHLHIPDDMAGGVECNIAPNQESVFHRHHELEIFVIQRGTGKLLIDGKDMGDVGPGDHVYLQPFHGHTLRNLSDTEQLVFTALYWARPTIVAPTSSLPRRTLIFSTPPTPNGDLHLGHLSGPYLGADVYRRYLLQKGVEAIHITGRDDNQTYVKRIAMAENRAPEEVADDYAKRIRDTWKKAAIPLDFFSVPNTSTAYQNQLASVIARLMERGAIVEKTVEELYDVNTGFSLHEGYVKGTCPHCESDSDGNACEQCGRPNDCVDLLYPMPTLAGAEIGRRSIRKLYFRMSAVASELAQLVDRSNMSTRARALSAGMLADGLPDICISHRSDWGIPVGLAGYEDQVIYVWFEMAAGYLSADQQATSERPFFMDPDSPIVHFYGFDNTYYHTLLFPAVYLALGGDLNVPADHVINELLFLRDKKFSTSRRHLIWAKNLLSHVRTDYVRWGLSRTRPELRNENFDLDQFISNTNKFFSERLEGWLRRSLSHLAKRHYSAVPESGAWTQQHIAFYREARHLAESAERGYQVNSFSLQTVTRRLEELVQLADDFFATQCRHEVSDVMHDHHRTTTALNFWAIALFARLSIPIIPETGQYILDLLGLGDETKIDDVVRFIQHGNPVNTAIKPTFLPISADIGEAVLRTD